MSKIKKIYVVIVIPLLVSRYIYVIYKFWGKLRL